MAEVAGFQVLEAPKRNLWVGMRLAYLVSGLSQAHREMVKAMVMELVKLERLERGERFLKGDCEDPPIMLTNRETEILNFIAAGYPNRRIALEMAWSEPTVKRCVSLILRELNVANRAQAVVVAFRQGLIPLLKQQQRCRKTKYCERASQHEKPRNRERASRVE